MKITIIGTAYPYKGGGISTFNERLAAALQEQQHTVDIVTFTLQYPAILYPGKTQMSSEQAPAGLHIRRMINSVNPTSWLRTGHQLKKEKADLIIVRFWLPFMGPAFGTILRLVKRNTHTKIICIADNIIPHEKRTGDTVFTNYFLPPIDAFLCMSKEVLKDLKTLVPKKPSLFHPHPLYDNFGRKPSRTEALEKLQLPAVNRYILFFGFIRKYKGLDLLLEAMASETLASENIHLIIAGEYFDEAAPYEQYIQEHALEQRVKRFTEFIPNDEVRYFFAVADLVVQPYRSATQSGITQIAYHFNVPMVVTDVGGLAENVPHGEVGFVVPPNAEALAAAILKFFKEERQQEMIQAIQIVKKKFTWEAFITSLLSLVKSS